MQGKAFSLFELMVALAIVSITSGAAYPSYKHHVQTSRRTQAQVQLHQVAHGLEKYFSLHHHYQGAQAPSNTAYYRFALKLSSKHSYVITATPIGSQRNDRCGALSLNNNGQQNAADNNCW